MSGAAAWPGIETIEPGLRGLLVGTSDAADDRQDFALNQLDGHVSVPDMLMMFGPTKVGDSATITPRPERQALE